uniref:Zgc:92161 n=1 Tax=Paramormyrops kingsleyae TaxID=1676925 RepID=A0A3B3SRV4_9TELE
MAASKAQSFLITGANRGLGLEMVKQLVESRASTCRLFAACRDPDAPKSQALQDLAKKYPKVITVIQLDTTDPRSMKEAAMKVGAKLEGGGLNVLVNNAGVLPRGDLLHTSEQEFQMSMDTNLMGPVRVTKVGIRAELAEINQVFFTDEVVKPVLPWTDSLKTINKPNMKMH